MPIRIVYPPIGSTVSEWRGAKDPRPSPIRLNEADLLRHVRAGARQTGWRFYHAAVAFGSPGGFPDVVLVKPPRLVIAELKGPAPKWKPGQREWIADLQAVAAVSFGAFECYVWTPDDWTSGRIQRILGGLA